jgi:hypothetical protein
MKKIIGEAMMKSRSEQVRVSSVREKCTFVEGWKRAKKLLSQSHFVFLSHPSFPRFDASFELL